MFFSSASPLRGYQAVEVYDLVAAVLTLYQSLHICVTPLIHAVSNTSRGLDATFILTCQGSLSSE